MYVIRRYCYDDGMMLFEMENEDCWLGLCGVFAYKKRSTESQK